MRRRCVRMPRKFEALPFFGRPSLETRTAWPCEEGVPSRSHTNAWGTCPGRKSSQPSSANSPHPLSPFNRAPPPRLTGPPHPTPWTRAP
jgi:hypothetical protein